MRLNLQVSMGSLSTACLAVSFSAFGMNLHSGLETNSVAFGAVVAGSGLFGGLMYAKMNRKYRESISQFDVASHSTMSSVFSSLNSPYFVHGVFSASKLSDEQLRQILTSAMGRGVTDNEISRIKLIADQNGNREVTLNELLKFLGEWRG